ncbi:hypothetical protein Anas_05371 [Armadillidium nasatum]|uniref:Uncharacterized protein n=1 Tax=Armadillidium nasatum TaxID=96803 RepID=A0A5N5SS80_9CRUS|nr:hypothetical protein Anas_05371 [Armadillidium nasatum]
MPMSHTSRPKESESEIDTANNSEKKEKEGISTSDTKKPTPFPRYWVRVIEETQVTPSKNNQEEFQNDNNNEGRTPNLQCKKSKQILLLFVFNILGLVPSKAPPPVAIPAALAGAMMKEKKPFTYTPGGLNLAEIKSPRMQRRLQRNASMEGVRPSPLAQQPPQSPGTSAPAMIPHHGMIQVLPMPGMGMAPVVKPQPKEPPKPKRNVCGPAPPPPPFAISGESSIEHSPSATPLTTPASTPASSSGISSAATSALSSQSTAPISNSNSLETDEQLIKEKLEKAAEPGSNIPSPPPPPPSSTASHKRYSLPSLSSQQSSSPSRPESESLQSSISTFSSSNDASKSSNDLPPNEKENIVINTSKVEEKSESAIENEKKLTPINCDSSQGNQELSNETKENNKEISSSDHDQESKIVKLDCKSESRNKEESQSTEKIEPQTKLDNKVTVIENSNLSPKTETLSQPQTNHNHSKTFVQDNVQIQENASNQTQSSHEVFSPNSMPLEKSNFVNQKVLPKPLENRQNITSINIQQNQSTPPIDKRSPNAIPTERVNAGVENNKQSPKIQDNLHNTTSVTFQPFRTGVRMASPPTEVRRSQNSNFDRMTRQASLPADANSPQINANLGSIYVPPVSIYVPPVRQISSESPGQSKSAPQSAHCLSSSPTGLNKGPLPWMCGVKKEPSPPPEFLVYAQKAQDRIQRQRSLTQQDNNRQQIYNPKGNETKNLQQNGYFHPSTTYSPTNTITTKPTNNNEQYNWRLPAHQASLKNQQHQQQQQQQQAQQQKSQVSNFNQPQTQIGQQSQQTRFSQFSQQQSMTLPKNRPKERIIPIMMEESSLATTPSSIPMSGGTNTLPNKMNYQSYPQRQHSWSKPSSVPSSPMGVNAAFSPFDQDNHHPSSNALEALQQMQQNLAKLNCGPQIEASSEPRKYAGSQIPSRSFRMLQTMTDDVPSGGSSPFQEMLRRDESSQRGEDPNNSSKTLTNLSSSIHSPSITPSSSSASIALSDCEIGSRVAPSYTNTSDSHVYRHVTPKIISNSPSSERVVNSALCARRDAPSKIWQNDCIL